MFFRETIMQIKCMNFFFFLPSENVYIAFQSANFDITNAKLRYLHNAIFKAAFQIKFSSFFTLFNTKI